MAGGMKWISYIGGGLIWVGIVYLVFIGIPPEAQGFKGAVKAINWVLGGFLFMAGAYHGAGVAKQLSPFFFNSLVMLAGALVIACSEGWFVEGPEGGAWEGEKGAAMSGWFLGGCCACVGHKVARAAAGIDLE